MITLAELREALGDRNLKEVSRRSGVPYMQIYNIVKRGSEPKYGTVKALVEYLQGQPA